MPSVPISNISQPIIKEQLNIAKSDQSPVTAIPGVKQEAVLLNNSDIITADNIRYWLTKPDALLKLFGSSVILEKMFQNAKLSQTAAKTITDKLTGLMDSLILSAHTKNNQLFVRDFVVKTGLILENHLASLATGTTAPGIDKMPEDSIKLLLMRLAATVSDTLKESGKQDSAITAKLQQLLSFAEDGIKSIEAKQVLNTVYQKSDSGLILQIPIALAGGLRLAEIFIRPDDKSKKGEKKFTSCSVIIFLDMDKIGPIAISAAVREGGFSCLIKCESEEIQKAINIQLQTLKTKLTEIGYRVDYLECIKENDISGKRKEFISEQSFAQADILNIFA